MDEDEKKQILLMALYNITQIENKDDGGDWDEIDEAKIIAKKALKEYADGNKLYLVSNRVVSIREE